MKNKYIFCFIMLMVQYETMAQGGLRITWPLDRTIFQRDASGGTDVWFAGEFGYQQLANGGNGVQYYVYPVDKQTGVRSTTAITFSGQVYVSISNALSSPHGNIKTFYGKLGRHATGWYDLEVSVSKNIVCGLSSNLSAKRYVRFGVGDVFILAGQSNASGYTWNDDIASIPHHTTNLDIPDAVNFLNGGYVKREEKTTDVERVKMPRALPINANNDDKAARHKFYAFEVTPTTGTPATHPNPAENEINIYPNGQASWTWAPMAYKMYQNTNQVPMMFFNAAWPGSSSYFWNPEVNGDVTNPHWAYGQFRDVLLMYGHIFGVKRVLWQQGEADGGTSTLDYELRVGKTISQSRNDLGHSSLGWSIAKSTFDGSRNPNILPLIQQAQQNLANATYNKIGAYTDDITTINNNDGRGTGMQVHFSGAVHNSVGERWANTFGSNTDGTPFTSGQELQQLTITDNGSTFRLQAPTNFQRYFWVKNENGLYNTENTNANHTQNYIDVPKGSNTIDYYTCYMSNDVDDDASNGYKMRMFVSQSFVVPNSIDAGQLLDLVDVFSWNAPKPLSNKIAKILAKNVDWTITISQNAQNWLSTSQGCGFDGLTELSLVAQENTGTNTRYGTITITGSDGEIETIPVTQAGITSTCETKLGTLVPYNSSGEWQGFGTTKINKSIDNNTLYVSGQAYSYGIGTHATSHIKYNLAGQGYNTFGGKVGMDDEVDNSCGATQRIRFIIKGDNSTLFTSSDMGPTSPAENFNVSVSGYSTLELIVEQLDNNACDHADWLDPTLYCSSPPSCTTAPPIPTNVSASPTSISSGGSSTLSATCAVGTPNWSTGAVGNSITVSPTSTTNYSVTCVNGSCPPSNPVNIGVIVNTGACSAVTNNLVMGTWNVTGHQLVARNFNNQYWLTQRIGTNPDAFVVRGSGMLQRGDVSLTNGSYYNMVGCFTWQYSNWNSLENPSISTFTTPAGYSIGYELDGTIFYTATTGGGTGNGCTDTYVTNAWASATIGYGSNPKIGLRHDGGAMVIGSTTYTQGIGTHAASEIVYTFSNNPYANFKASVGRDAGANSCNCGGQTIVFKVYDHNTGALIGGPITKTINQGFTDMTVPIAGLSAIRLVVEEGGDGNSGDWADWGNARFTCANSNARQAAEQIPIEEAIEGLEIFPNPTNDKLTTKFSLSEASKVSFDIVDMQGRNLAGGVSQSYQYKGESGIRTFIIDVSKLNAGSYLLRGVIGSKLEVKKFVIER